MVNIKNVFAALQFDAKPLGRIPAHTVYWEIPLPFGGCAKAENEIIFSSRQQNPENTREALAHLVARIKCLKARARAEEEEAHRKQ